MMLSIFPHCKRTMSNWYCPLPLRFMWFSLWLELLDMIICIHFSIFFSLVTSIYFVGMLCYLMFHKEFFLWKVLLYVKYWYLFFFCVNPYLCKLLFNNYNYMDQHMTLGIIRWVIPVHWNICEIVNIYIYIYFYKLS